MHFQLLSLAPLHSLGTGDNQGLMRDRYPRDPCQSVWDHDISFTPVAGLRRPLRSQARRPGAGAGTDALWT